MFTGDMEVGTPVSEKTDQKYYEFCAKKLWTNRVKHAEYADHFKNNVYAIFDLNSGLQSYQNGGSRQWHSSVKTPWKVVKRPEMYMKTT